MSRDYDRIERTVARIEELGTELSKSDDKNLKQEAETKLKEAKTLLNDARFAIALNQDEAIQKVAIRLKELNIDSLNAFVLELEKKTTKPDTRDLEILKQEVILSYRRLEILLDGIKSLEPLLQNPAFDSDRTAHATTIQTAKQLLRTARKAAYGEDAEVLAGAAKQLKDFDIKKLDSLAELLKNAADKKGKPPEKPDAPPPPGELQKLAEAKRLATNGFVKLPSGIPGFSYYFDGRSLFSTWSGKVFQILKPEDVKTGTEKDLWKDFTDPAKCVSFQHLFLLNGTSVEPILKELGRDPNAFMPVNSGVPGWKYHLENNALFGTPNGGATFFVLDQQASTKDSNAKVSPWRQVSDAPTLTRLQQSSVAAAGFPRADFQFDFTTLPETSSDQPIKLRPGLRYLIPVTTTTITVQKYGAQSTIVLPTAVGAHTVVYDLLITRTPQGIVLQDHSAQSVINSILFGSKKVYFRCEPEKGQPAVLPPKLDLTGVAGERAKRCERLAKKTEEILASLLPRLEKATGEELRYALKQIRIETDFIGSASALPREADTEWLFYELPSAQARDQLMMHLAALRQSELVLETKYYALLTERSEARGKKLGETIDRLLTADERKKLSVGDPIELAKNIAHFISQVETAMPEFQLDRPGWEGNRITDGSARLFGDMRMMQYVRYDECAQEDCIREASRACTILLHIQAKTSLLKEWEFSSLNMMGRADKAGFSHFAVAMAKLPAKPDPKAPSLEASKIDPQIIIDTWLVPAHQDPIVFADPSGKGMRKAWEAEATKRSIEAFADQVTLQKSQRFTDVDSFQERYFQEDPTNRAIVRSIDLDMAVLEQFIDPQSLLRAKATPMFFDAVKMKMVHYFDAAGTWKTIGGDREEFLKISFGTTDRQHVRAWQALDRYLPMYFYVMYGEENPVLKKYLTVSAAEARKQLGEGLPKIFTGKELDVKNKELQALSMELFQMYLQKTKEDPSWKSKYQIFVREYDAILTSEWNGGHKRQTYEKLRWLIDNFLDSLDLSKEERQRRQHERESSLEIFLANETNPKRKLKLVQRFSADPSLNYLVDVQKIWLPDRKPTKEEMQWIIRVTRNLWFRREAVSPQTVHLGYERLVRTRKKYANVDVFDRNVVLACCFGLVTDRLQNDGTPYDNETYAQRERSLGRKQEFLSPELLADIGRHQKIGGDKKWQLQSIMPIAKNVEAVKKAKDTFLTSVKTMPSPSTFIFQGHAGPGVIAFTGDSHEQMLKNGWRPEDLQHEAISSKEMADALKERAKKFPTDGTEPPDQKDLIILAGCYNSDFIRNVHQQLGQISRQPIFIGASEYGQYTHPDYDHATKYGSLFFSSVMDISSKNPVTIGSIFEHENAGDEDPSIYVEEDGDLFHLTQEDAKDRSGRMAA